MPVLPKTRRLRLNGTRSHSPTLRVLCRTPPHPPEEDTGPHGFLLEATSAHFLKDSGAFARFGIPFHIKSYLAPHPRTPSTLRRLRPPLTAIHGKFPSWPPQADPRCLPTRKLNHTSLSSSHRGEFSEAKVNLPPHTHFVLIARPAYPKQKQPSQLAELNVCCSQQSSHHLFLCFELHSVNARHPEPRARDRGHETQRA